ncbi:MAG: 30S ribosomal protein S2 [Candidatus Diapherotrites archaeon]|uniref:Small ribosomal subunit protein uS2 n=1 Tax=Candidatus Iainarchaeum sp. TaxID=3101447 RepID=A0A938YY72_9ARCH|nr:30S ribosomal protein S2 [Candidatus Diapherotrites archaeon]
MSEKEEKKSHLIELDKYLKTGSHIGTKFKTGDMQKYIFKQRKDGLRVLDVSTIDERIRAVASFLSRFEPSKVIAISRKVYGQQPVKEFSEAIGAKAMTARFVPGTFTNPSAKGFVEPGVIIVADPESDKQAIEESVKLRIPVVGLCSTNNYLRNIDVAIPINNKGRKSIALVFFLLAREILKEQGKIKKDTDFKKEPEDFEYKLQEGAEEAEETETKRPKFRRKERR